jgi:hypothetical protein
VVCNHRIQHRPVESEPGFYYVFIRFSHEIFHIWYVLPDAQPKGDICHNHRIGNGSDDQTVRGAAGVSGMERRQFLRLYGASMILGRLVRWVVNEPVSRLRGVLNV